MPLVPYRYVAHPQTGRWFKVMDTRAAVREALWVAADRMQGDARLAALESQYRAAEKAEMARQAERRTG